MARTPTRPLSRLPAAFVLLLVGAGCADQGEGERCDRQNGNADCESGLVCTSAEDLNPFPGSEASGAALCCPPEGAATVEACFPRGFAGLGDSGTSGSAGAAATDSGVTDGG